MRAPARRTARRDRTRGADAAAARHGAARRGTARADPRAGTAHVVAPVGTARAVAPAETASPPTKHGWASATRRGSSRPRPGAAASGLRRRRGARAVHRYPRQPPGDGPLLTLTLV